MIDGRSAARSSIKKYMVTKWQKNLKGMVSTLLVRGTIYPLLLRRPLKEELVKSTLKKSTAGPRRKYYSLTPKGELELNKFIERWNNLQSNVNKVLCFEPDTKYTKGNDTIKNKLKLSKESQESWKNLRVYLF